MDGNKDKGKVCIVHHDLMQLHTPPHYVEAYELPRRVIAIQNRLKGLKVSNGFPPEEQFGGPMRIIPACCGAGKRPVGYGSIASAKRQRTAYSCGPCSEGSAWAACKITEAPEVDPSDLLRVHGAEHVSSVTKLCELAATERAAIFPVTQASDGGSPEANDADEDIYYCPDTLGAAKLAAGGAVQAVRELFNVDKNTGHAIGRSDVGASFAIVRPPGHHCAHKAAGFCLFNNTAVAASHARTVLGLKRVAIVDWDFHHGDGQQQLFYDDPSILTISMHVAISENGLVFPQWDEMGISFNGSGAGIGHNINIPWPNDRVGASEYEEAFETIVIPALKGFDPELILVASGFDAMMGDILAGTRLQADSYHKLTKQLLTLDRPIAVILEGGYGPELIAEAALNVVHALLRRPPPLQNRTTESTNTDDSDDDSSDSDNPCRNGIDVQHVLDAVRRRLNGLSPWEQMRGAGGEPYFLETPDGADSSKAAAAELTKVIAQLVEEEKIKTTYYKQVGGLRYKRELLEKAEEFAKDGQISEAEAKELWEDALDGPGVTPTERRTLSYTMQKFKYTDKAARFLKPLLLEQVRSYYKQVNGVKYDRLLLEKAEGFGEKGQVSIEQAKELWEDAQDGNRVTEVEKRTLLYSMRAVKFSNAASEFLKPLLA